MKKIIILCLFLCLFGCSSKSEEVEEVKEVIIENVDSSSLNNVYYYNFLNDTEKLYYDALLESSLNSKNYFELDVSLDTDVLYKALNAFTFDYPLYYWWRLGLETTYTSNSFKAVVNIDDIESSISQIESKKDEILGECKDDNNYEYVKNIHDYLVNNVEYVTDSEHCHDLYGSLIENKSVCDGYSLAFKYLLNEAGFNSIVVDGKGIQNDDLVEHGWNYVELNGNWYLVDVTWDDTSSNNESIVYDYFLLSDEMISLDHIKNDLYEYPKCNDEGLFYVNMSGKYIKDYSEDELSNLINNLIDTENKDIYLKFSNYDDGVKAYKYLLEDKNFESIYTKHKYGNYSLKYGGVYNNASHVLHVYYEVES